MASSQGARFHAEDIWGLFWVTLSWADGGMRSSFDCWRSQLLTCTYLSMYLCAYALWCIDAECTHALRSHSETLYGWTYLRMNSSRMLSCECLVPRHPTCVQDAYTHLGPGPWKRQSNYYAENICCVEAPADDNVGHILSLARCCIFLRHRKHVVNIAFMTKNSFDIKRMLYDMYVEAIFISLIRTRASLNDTWTDRETRHLLTQWPWLCDRIKIVRDCDRDRVSICSPPSAPFCAAAAMFMHAGTPTKSLDGSRSTSWFQCAHATWQRLMPGMCSSHTYCRRRNNSYWSHSSHLY